MNFSGTRKKGRVACLAACEHVCFRVKNLGIRKVNLVFKGSYLKWKRAILLLFRKEKIKVKYIIDKTPISYNGCKRRKKKR